MKITFINLPAPYLVTPDAQVPLGILYLAAVLMPTYKVDVKNYATFTEREAIDDLGHSDVFGITACSMQLSIAERIAMGIRWKYPNSKIILGGPACVTTDYFNSSIYDATFYGDCERTIFDYLTTLENKHYICDPIDLDYLPLPARYLLSNQGGNIFAYGINYKPGGSTQLITSRGCPYKCAYCATPNKKVRFRSIKSIVEEIKQVIKDFGIRQFRINDDHFMQRKERVYEFCDAVKDLDIVWRISTRVKPCDVKLLTAMKNAGLKEISLGIESFDDNVLERLNKGVTVFDNVKMINACKKARIPARLLMMVNTPFQTERTIDDNKYYLTRFYDKYEIISVTHFKPLPGTDVWKHPDKYGIKIISKDMNDYNFYHYGNQRARVFKYIDIDTADVEWQSDEFVKFVELSGKINHG